MESKVNIIEELNLNSKMQQTSSIKYKSDCKT